MDSPLYAAVWRLSDGLKGISYSDHEIWKAHELDVLSVISNKVGATISVQNVKSF